MVKNENREKLRVAAYCRSDNVDGYDAQTLRCMDRINSNPDWTFAGIYYDRGKNGFQINEQLKRLLNDCEAGKIDLVLVRSISRLSRTTKGTLEIIRRLTELGIPIIFDKEGLNSMDDGEILMMLLEAVAKGEEESAAREAEVRKERWRRKSGAGRAGERR